MSVKVRTYKYLYVRVEYPAERGYRMEPYVLPNWIYVTITEEGNSKYLTVNSRIHVNKEVRMSPSYSSKFTDREILIDMSGKVSEAFL